MKCSFCDSTRSRVLESRIAEGGGAIRRRRECLSCLRRFTTYERALEMPLVVVKKDGRREAFDRRKIQMGMMKACEKRPISLDQIEQAATEIETELRNEPSAEVSAARVGEKVMERLLKMDDVAYVRFASVYKEFDDAKKFAEVLAVLSGGRRRSIPHPSARGARDKSANGDLAVLKNGRRTRKSSTTSQQIRQKKSRHPKRPSRAKP